jgi:hypothetical protein
LSPHLGEHAGDRGKLALPDMIAGKHVSLEHTDVELRVVFLK